jgi:hypothetical protein
MVGIGTPSFRRWWYQYAARSSMVGRTGQPMSNLPPLSRKAEAAG